MAEQSSDPLYERVRANRAWSEFAESIGAEFRQGESYAARVHSPSFRGWEMMLDRYATREELLNRTIWRTRVRAPFRAMRPFRLEVRRLSWRDSIARLAGSLRRRSSLQYVKTGDRELDARFAIRSGSGAEVRDLFANPRIRALIAEQESMDLRVAEVVEEGVSAIVEWIDELHFEARGGIADAERLRSLFELFAEMLDHLLTLGIVEPRGRSVYGV